MIVLKNQIEYFPYNCNIQGVMQDVTDSTLFIPNEVSGEFTIHIYLTVFQTREVSGNNEDLKLKDA